MKCCNVENLKSCNAAKLQCCKVASLQNCKVAKVQSSRLVLKLTTSWAAVAAKKKVGLSRATLDSQVKVFHIDLTGLPSKKYSMDQ